MNKVEQVCPVCGCNIGTDAYEKDDVIYCCRACASGSQCECGCCEVLGKEPEM